MMPKEATSACWCRISRARSLAGAGGGAVLKPELYGGLDGDDEAIVHAQELLARPAALQLVAGLRPGAHERVGAAVEITRRLPDAFAAGASRHGYANEGKCKWPAGDAYAPSADK